MEWTGTFEIPNSGRRVGGRLTIDASESTLTTFGVLQDVSGNPSADIFREDDVDSVPMAWCVTEEGRHLTLLDLVPLGGNVGLTGTGLEPTRQQWIVGSAVGALIEPIYPVTFSSMSFGLTDLSAWLGAPHHTHEIRWGQPRIDVSATALDIKAKTDEGLDIGFGGRLQAQGGFDSVTVNYPTRVNATPPKEATWQSIVNQIVTPIETMLWTATGRFSALEEPSLRLDGDHPQYHRLWVSLLEPRSFSRPERRSTPIDMLYLGPDIPGGVETGLKKWFSVWEEISPAFGPVIARTRAPFTYANDRFHASVAALESYSDQRNKPMGLSKAQRKARRQRVKHAIETQAPELTDWVVEAVKQAERPSLRSRLDHLLSEAGDIGEAIVGADRDQFLTAVVKARNAYAHSTRIIGAIQGGSALHWVTQGLNWVLRYHALTELGFSSDDAQQRVLANSTFLQETQRIQQALAQPESA